jgi:hypothetical protein
VTGEVPLLGQTETVTITRIEKAGNAITNAFFYGVLSDPHAATDHRHNVNGVYMVSGSAGAVMAALQGLVFAAGGRHAWHHSCDRHDRSHRH